MVKKEACGEIDILCKLLSFLTWSPTDSAHFFLWSPIVAPIDFELSPTKFGDPLFFMKIRLIDFRPGMTAVRTAVHRLFSASGNTVKDDSVCVALRTFVHGVFFLFVYFFFICVLDCFPPPLSSKTLYFIILSDFLRNQCHTSIFLQKPMHSMTGWFLASEGSQHSHIVPAADGKSLFPHFQ